MGSTEGDRLIAEAESDPNFQGYGGKEKIDSDGEDDGTGRYGKQARQLENILGQVKRNDEKTE